MEEIWNWIATYSATILLFIVILAIIILKFVGKQLITKTIPSYMEEKGKNLATKQDVEEITRKTEQIEKEFKEDFEQFTIDVHYKSELFSKQYDELYTHLYAIIIQSEYIRHLMQLKSGQTYSFEEYPFLSVSPIHRTNTRIDFKEGRPATFSQTEEKIDTPESDFTCSKMCELIIEKGKYATPELLKLAVSYRLVHSIVKDSDVTENEDFRLQGEIVQRIVREYNDLRCKLKMNYNENELRTGRIYGIGEDIS